MPKVKDSIDVQVPVQQAYNQWTQFEEFPKFMEGIQSVQQLDNTHVRWAAEVRGECREWTTEITVQQPDEKIAWNGDVDHVTERPAQHPNDDVDEQEDGADVSADSSAEQAKAREQEMEESGEENAS